MTWFQDSLQASGQYEAWGQLSTRTHGQLIFGRGAKVIFFLNSNFIDIIYIP